MQKLDIENDITSLYSLTWKKLALPFKDAVEEVQMAWETPVSPTLVGRFWKEWVFALMKYWVSARTLNLSRAVSGDFDRIREITRVMELCRALLKDQAWGRELKGYLTSTMHEVAHFAGGVYRTLMKDVDQALGKAYNFTLPEVVPGEKDISNFLEICHFIYHSLGLFLVHMTIDSDNLPVEKLFLFVRDLYAAQAGINPPALNSFTSFFRYLSLYYCLRNREFLVNQTSEPWPGVTGPLNRLCSLWYLLYSREGV